MKNKVQQDKQYQQNKKIGRVFEGGAYRDGEVGKNDYEGFLSPFVLKAYGDYMTKHREQSNGEIRDSDNWQKGIPKSTYIKSLWRHFLDFWTIHRGGKVFKEGHEWTLEECGCAMMFNIMGYLHELLKSNTQDNGKTNS